MADPVRNPPPARLLQVEALLHRYGAREVLRLERLVLEAGEHALLLGPSGSGKSTLLQVIAGLLEPSQGQVSLCGQPLQGLRGAARDRFRGRHVGIVFQRLHLIDALSVRQNLAAAQYCAGLPADPSRIDSLLESLGLSRFADTRPPALSQGQAQRVAIARAVVNRPRILLADEPTSSLDDANAEAALALLRRQADDCGAALLVATHDARAKQAVARHVTLGMPA